MTQAVAKLSHQEGVGSEGGAGAATGQFQSIVTTGNKDLGWCGLTFLEKCKSGFSCEISFVNAAQIFFNVWAK